MKIILITLLLCFNLSAMARQPAFSSLQTRISDNEKTLSIQINGQRNSRKIHVNESFDVENMSRLRKELLKYQVFTNHGLGIPFQEVPGLIAVCLGSFFLFITVLILWYRSKQRAHTRVV
ncbi:hypothetical protein [Spirosoma linguale]|uniref:Uncharacterized protein n=1 Tax=Spirosoma linguale (strain ATCC 33905 / DSM 74 / LMG 10896 / Claus 1) TaxID=504472 RepID=D2QND7_SPILD|nr:hypothetical protein Slin_3315 [Spirosoma linguale DSM 74]